ncbi:HesA/MoeB/ThiF family protein [Mariniblastus fucicola]|uniref:Molybdopterin-synthase adenylyltransferase n=1 Tax=Mariniblastus fucicola TaxID=980251 RepID=A0A5B9PJ03_9BACT|nr:ThiF family adenylyltransferase [Mariniblastus fucicola]QEG24642.1 Molybdopterin-synthase adenylyltransferase [Mariniblastus fucicola]
MNPEPNKSDQETFVIDENDRYSRLKLIGWWEQERIAAAKILVVGAGALGNEVLKNLCLLGVGTIYIIDFDVVQESNLTRSVLFRSRHEGQPKASVITEMASDLNPDCTLIPIEGNVLTDIGIGLIRDMDVVIGCLDNREARLWVNRMSWKANTPWIDGGIQEINGVTKVFVPGDGPCYECGMTENDYRLISLRYSCPLLRQEDIQQGKVPTAPTIASIIGGMQVQEALKLLHDLPTDDGSAMVFNGAANQFYKTKFTPKEDCLSHETYEDVIESELTHESTLQEVCQFLELEEATLILDRDFLVRLNCRTCESHKQIDRPLCLVGSSEGVCDSCQQPLQPETVSEVSLNGEFANRSLASLGIPDWDVIKIRTPSETRFVLLNKAG